MKKLVKITIIGLLLLVAGCAHHSGYYSANSAGVNYGVGITAHAPYYAYPGYYRSYPVYYDRHVYIETPVIYEQHIHKPHNAYRGHKYDKHRKPRAGNYAVPERDREHSQGYFKRNSTNNYSKKHGKERVNNSLSTNKYPDRTRSNNTRSYSTNRSLSPARATGSKHSKGFSSRLNPSRK